jgi:hypothetical protein
MNWLKVGAVVVGGIVVFFIVDSVIHVFLGLLTALVFVAIVGGGVYAAAKIAGANKRRQLRRQGKHRDESRPADTRSAIARPEPGPAVPYRPAAQHNAPAHDVSAHDVEDDLERLKREMDR